MKLLRGSKRASDAGDLQKDRMLGSARPSKKQRKEEEHAGGMGTPFGKNDENWEASGGQVEGEVSFRISAQSCLAEVFKGSRTSIVGKKVGPVGKLGGLPFP